MREVKAVLARLEPMIVRMDATIAAVLPHLATKAELAILPHLATKAEVSDLRSELRAGLAAVPTKTYMWGILGVLVTAYAAGLAALAVIR
jgi:hypothetical protein